MRPFEMFLYVAVVFGWSTSWYPLSLQLGVVAPEVSIFWRFLVSSLMMLAITAFCGIRLRFEPGEHLRFLFLGMALFSTNFALFYNSSLYLASGLLAVILSMSSLINVVLVAAINRRPPPLLQMVAAIVGLVGLGLIFAPEFKTLPTAGIAVAYGVLATFSFCIGNLLSSEASGGPRFSPQPVGAWCMACCSWQSLPFCAAIPSSSTCRQAICSASSG